ncbi:BrnT family toxin (plasmid) [Acidithiobacillus sp. YTS05]|nr:BrnT family toxin [Acidithiobacillus sp. YTS05]
MGSFEFDEGKSCSNLEKHGIDFYEAQAIWKDDRRIEVPAKTVDEPRSMVIGRIGQKVWSAVVTPRGDNVRLISVSRARREEIELYESFDL